VGLALERHPARQAGLPLRIGVLGLGAGTLLTYGRRGDAIRIYEIDPEVERLSRAWFTYFDDTPATTEVIIGDGRLSLEREPDQAFDVLVLDAFSSDAIPLHLLTREAFAVFLRHVRPDGVLAVNVTNRHVDIRPVVAAHAEHFGLRALWVPDWTDDARGIYGSDWMLAAADGRLLVDPVLRAAAEPIPPSTDARPFTDDYTNLFSILVAPE
jgi:spermidine synthase